MMKVAFFVSCIASSIQGLQLNTSSSAYADLLANMSVNTNYASCHVVADRAKVNGENLKNMQKSRKRQLKFTDPAFSHDRNALFWEGVE